MRASTALVLLWSMLWAGVHAEVLQAMQQSWRFDFYDDSGNITMFPVYEQCQSMHVKWGRSSATGPSATAPYSFLIYTSIYQFPFFLDVGNSLSYDFEIPFSPGTQMQICMFDANGYTGGCQSVVSIVPNTTALSHTCTNETLSWPEGPLDVEAGDNQGPLSWTAWPEQCSDLQFTPKNGTPPYTLQVAPASHPPYNTTLEDMSTFNWTVALTWATPFFVSIVDADYNLWSIGMLHSGDGKASCLGGPTVTKVSAGAAAGAGIGGLVLGLTLGALATWFFLKRHRTKRNSLSSSTEPLHDPPYTHDYPSLGLSAGYFDQRQSHVDLYSPTGMTGVGSGNGMSSPTHGVTSPMHGTTSPTHGVTSPSGGMAQVGGSSVLAYPQTTTSTTSRHHPPDSTGSDGGLQSGHNVYVLHHDGGAAPVTVFHGDDTQVVELPPRYAGDGDGDRSGQEETRHHSVVDLRRASRSDLQSSSWAGMQNSSQTDLRSSRKMHLRNPGEESATSDAGTGGPEAGQHPSFSPRMLVDQRRPVGVKKPTGPR